MEPIANLIRRLNQTDETTNLEVKRGRAIDQSIMETVCSFSNEPGLGGGHILLGVAEAEGTLFQTYEVEALVIQISYSETLLANAHRFSISLCGLRLQ